MAGVSQTIVNGAALLYEYCLGAFLALQGFAETYRDGIEILSSGLMFGSGAVIPPLSPESLGLGGLYKALMAVWALAFATFMWLNRFELAANAPWALAGLSVISILAMLVSRLSLEPFKPFVPFAMATGLVVTTKIVPRIVQSFRPDNRPFHDDIRLAEQGNRMRGSDQASLGSSRSGRIMHGILDHSDPWNTLLLSHMDHSDLENNVRRIPSSEGSISSIDPNFGLEEASSTDSVDSRDPLL